MKSKSELQYKQDIFIQLAFSLYGYIVGTPKFPQIKSFIIESLGFVVDEEGCFYLINYKNKPLQSIDLEQEVMFVILKEGLSVSEMFDIKIQGKAVLVDNEDEQIIVIQELFKDKSPYLAFIPFVNNKLLSDFYLLKLIPKKISFQNFNDLRQGGLPVFLEKE